MCRNGTQGFSHFRFILPIMEVSGLNCLDFFFYLKRRLQFWKLQG